MMALMFLGFLLTFALLGGLVWVSVYKLLRNECWVHRWLPYRYSPIARAMVSNCRECAAKRVAPFEPVN
jgi:hypothetical protein